MNMDRINELPEEILCHIVSFLGLKDAVASSMISHRWRHLWKPLILTKSNLEFDTANMFGGSTTDLRVDQSTQQEFVKRVHGFLRFCSIEKVDTLKVAFELEATYAADLDAWIRFALEKGAQVLDLQISHYYRFPHRLLLSNSSLKHLSVHNCVLQHPPDRFHKFKQLTSLHLHRVTSDKNFTACIFSNCSFLERLTLSDCKLWSFLIITGPPCLTDLKVLDCDLRNVEISAANLVSLELNMVTDITCIETPRLARLFLCEGPESTCNGLAQFASCPMLESLYLDIYWKSEIPETISAFRNLKQMRLFQSSRTKLDFQFGSSVLNILKSAPLLEELELVVSGTKEEVRKHSVFEHNHLRKVRIRCFHGRLCEIELAILILKIATKLEKMVIDPLGKVYHGDGRWVGQNSYCCLEEDEECHGNYNYHNNDVDGIPHLWKQRGRARIREILEAVEIDAQVIIL